MKNRCVSFRMMLAFLMLFLGIFRLGIFSNTIYKAYSILILTLMWIWLLRCPRTLWKNLWPMILAGTAAFSIVQNRAGLVGIANAMVYVLRFCAPFFLCRHLAHKYGLIRCVLGGMAASMITCALMDVSVLLGLEFDPDRYQNLSLYLFGNKFMVSYLHMQALGFAGQYLCLTGRWPHWSGKILLAAFGSAGMAMCAHVQCTTGMIGIAVMTAMLLLPLGGWLRKILSHPQTVLAIFAAANALLLNGDFLWELPMVQGLVVDILHEDLTLNGRLNIYAILPKVFEGHWLFGYGYGSDTITNLIGYGNAQNGILQYVLDGGLIGLGALIGCWMHCLGIAHRHSKRSWPMVCAMYGFAVCALAEVCFNNNFMLVLAILACMDEDAHCETSI